jgi:predicted GNAT family N-acyltransferase
MLLRPEIIEFATPEYDATISLRYEILRAPLGLEFTEDQLSEEYKDIHLAMYDASNNLVACLVLGTLPENTLKMRQVAVKTKHQKLGIGKALVEYSESYARHVSARKMVLNARKEAVPFYKKLNYHLEGKEFVEVGIPHYFMWKEM